MLNGYGVNGAYVPTWVVRAAVVAAAAAAVVTVAPQRILMATAYGDANVVITLTETQVVAARATGSAGVTSSSVTPRIIYSGAVDADAAATGYALVIRVIPASAGGDAFATGSALPDTKLGEALATAASTVVVCDAHRIRPGASTQLAVATTDPIASLVTRRTLLPTVATAVATGRGEPSIKLDGESYFRHDGYVLNAVARCVPQIDQNKMALIASFGSIDYGNSSGGGTAFVRHRALASGTGVVTPQAVAATRTARATVKAPALATATVDGTRVRNAAVSANATATRVLLRPAQRFAAASSSNAFLNAALVEGVRQARGTATGQSTAYQNEIFFGSQRVASGGGIAIAYGVVGGTTVNGTAISTASASGSATTATQHYANASGVVLALAGTATTGDQSFATAAGQGVAGAIVTETFNPGARGFATATALASPADFQRATVAASARSIAELVNPGNQFYADLTAPARAVATVASTFNPGARGFATATGTGTTAEFQRATVSASAVSLGVSVPGNQFYANSSATSRAVATVGTPRHNYAARVLGSAGASAVSSQFGNQFYADLTAQSRAVATVTGTFNPGARGFATATGSGATAEFQRASSNASARASGVAVSGNQFYASLNSISRAVATVTGTFNPGARGFATATSQARPADFIRAEAAGVASAFLSASHFGTQHRAISAGSAVASTTPIETTYRLVARATGLLANATAVLVNARAISDEPAPDERQMSVSGEDRGMMVPAEDRTMVVSA